MTFVLVMLHHGVATARPPLTIYDSPYYRIHTDLGPVVGREANVRMTKMFEEYRRRTSSFTVKIREKLPFYLFRNHADYVAAGGLPGSIGVFTGDRLMASMHDDSSWSTVQHEGFHQFVHVVVGRALPTWVNEGMAEYFEVARFTGDGFVVALIPPLRLARIKRMISQEQHLPMAEMMQVTRQEWNRRMSSGHYDQAWSMVHFLAHGDGGKYERAFSAFLHEAGRTGVWDRAWIKNFGSDLTEFETVWRKYWLGLPQAPTADLDAQAVVATMTSFLARAASQKQTFNTADAFFQEARAGNLRFHPKDWLPPSLLESALDQVGRTGKWSLARGSGTQLICVTPTGDRIIGTFNLRKNRVGNVSTQIKTR